MESLDGKHVVFGQVISGFEVLFAMSKQGRDVAGSGETPLRMPVITDSGILE